jgi:flagellum-specific peptidoglycan hydrolase FlgJ
MLIQHLLQKTKVRFLKEQLSIWLEKHWIKLLALSFCAYLAVERNLTVDLHFSTTRPHIEVSTPTASTVSFPGAINESPALPTLASNDIESEVVKQQRQYVQRFARVAKIEQEKYGIPASIKLAQGLLESQAGNSPLARNNNNHFGIKCFSRQCKEGHCRNFGDDSHKDFFRIYPSAWESYRAHSQLLRNESRYQPLFEYSVTDYKSWAHGLAKAGYATDKQYARKIIRLIEKLELAKYSR